MADRAPGSPVLAHGALEGRNVVNGVHASFLLAKGGGYTGHTSDRDAEREVSIGGSIYIHSHRPSLPLNQSTGCFCRNLDLLSDL